jgi:hypothetical protein
MSQLGIDRLVTHTESFGEFDINADGKIAFQTEHAGPTFTLEVKGRIAGQHTFTLIDTIVGSSPKTINTIMWDFLQINVTVYDSTSNYVHVLASGTSSDSGTVALNSISTPAGSLVAVSDLVFTSSNGSVGIVANTVNNNIDFQALTAGAAKYVKTVILGDWTGPSAGEYTLLIPHSQHGIANPEIACYETNGTGFDQILMASNIDASNNITISVPQTPDSRFIGKIVIE